MKNSKQLGYEAEQFVVDRLVARGFSILARNYTIRGGEIDIIARCKDCVVFVEVKMRTKHHFDLATVITPAKQRTIIVTAEHFLATHHIDALECRFDVALIEPNEKKEWQLTYLEHAFFQDW